MVQPLVATRAAGLAAMQAFSPAMGSRYANGRNHDRGPGRHKAVSLLSPYVRRRLITEQELVAAALAAFRLNKLPMPKAVALQSSSDVHS